MNRPWMQFHTRDWLDNKELRRCSAIARAVLVDLLCIAHEGEPYGHLSDSVGPLTDLYLCSRCVVTHVQFRKAVDELIETGRIARIDGVLSCPRMVRDEEIRLARAAGGSKGGNPELVKRKVILTDNHIVKPSSDSDSVSSIFNNQNPEEEKPKSAPKSREFAPGEWSDTTVADWIDAVQRRHPNKSDTLMGRQILCAVSDIENPEWRAEFDRVHRLWCGTPKWTEKRGAFCPKLAQWVMQEDYRHEPPPDIAPEEKLSGLQLAIKRAKEGTK